MAHNITSFFTGANGGGDDMDVPRPGADRPAAAPGANNGGEDSSTDGADLYGDGQRRSPSGGTGLQGEGARAGGDDSCTKENLRPLFAHEVDFVVRGGLSYTVGQPTRSPSRVVGNFRFRLLIFPSGTHSTQGNQVSAFVEADPGESLDPRWVYHSVKYQITIINWHDYRRSVTKVDTWTFSKDGIDRGWHDMVRTAELTQEAGWLGPDNSLAFRASVYVRQADGINVGSEYNFKKETGYIGLKNHGATCYMNGLLQSLFHVGEFRRIVYSLEVPDPKDNSVSPGKMDSDGSPFGKKRRDSEEDGEEAGTPSLIKALQNVFYKMQTSDQAVTCRELMKSFGWDTMDAFTQHDAQELNRILCDRLEEQMKGTPMDGSIKKLFEGEMENYIECCDIDYKSQRSETFYDIQLNIKGERGQELANIMESLRDFTAEETLEGDNAYEAEGHGKQRAKKGIRFKTFPPVLNLQLKRFHFDLEKMDMVKLNSRFEFPTRLELAEFATGGAAYVLHAVVVHSGDVNSGHYYVHIKPTPDSGWVKFDDDTVTPCSEFAAIEDNFGGNDLMVWNYFDRLPRELATAQAPTRARIHNAYMLVYIREDSAQEILAQPDPMAVNCKMVERCNDEVRLAELRRREKMEASTKIRVKMVFEKDLMKMTGFWDHQDITNEQNLKMGRDQQVKELGKEVEQLIDVPWNHLVFFSLHCRNNPRQVRFSFMTLNSSFRSHIPQFNAPHFDTTDPYLMVLCVASRGYDIETFKWNILREPKADELARWHDDQVILLIVKYFCPKNLKVITLGCYYTPHSEPLIGMVNDGWVTDRLRTHVDNKNIAALPAEGALVWECWEEFSERDIQLRNAKRAIKTEQLWSGDVIIWQPASTPSDPLAEAQLTTPEPGAEGDAPAYPVNNVAQLAAHTANSIDVIVTLHDSRQPQAVDGCVANGNWSLLRAPVARAEPAIAKGGGAGSGAGSGGSGGGSGGGSAGGAAAKEESVEIQGLQLSPAQFNMPQEKEIKMDLRWHLHHVTATINRAFNLPSSASDVWLFHGAPSASPEEPLNAHAGRNDQTILKEVQRSAMYISSPSKKPLLFHAIELPFQPGREVYERGLCPLAIRFFDDVVREVGNCVVLVPNGATVQDVLAEAKKHMIAEWGLTGQLRLLEVIESRLHKVYRSDSLVRSFMCFNKANIFYHSLRVEMDSENATAPGTPDKQCVEIFHCDRQSQQPFSQPFLMTYSAGEKALSIKTRLKAKLRIPDAEFKSWRLVRVSQGGVTKTHLKDDEVAIEDLADTKLCVEHSHPNPSSNLARQSRYNKPLTIK